MQPMNYHRLTFLQCFETASWVTFVQPVLLIPKILFQKLGPVLTFRRGLKMHSAFSTPLDGWMDGWMDAVICIAAISQNSH